MIQGGKVCYRIDQYIENPEEEVVSSLLKFLQSSVVRESETMYVACECLEVIQSQLQPNLGEAMYECFCFQN